VKAGFSIVLSDFSTPFFTDYHLPTGNLREHKKGLKRADVLIFTKCPSDLSAAEKEVYARRANFPKDRTFFSRIDYGSWIPMTPAAQEDRYEHVLLLTGIANPFPLQDFLAKNYKTELLRFKDHHVFTLKDIAEIREKFDTFAHGKKALVTTEKDFMRLRPFLTNENMQKIPWFYQSMEVKIDREEAFIHELNTYVNTI
jgi:tetraacyldisaccharide 4'-kinase